MGGRIRCRQCSAKSKRTKHQCRSPAMKNKQVCRIHGGLSTGPKTAEGRRKCAAAKVIHGRDTRQKRADDSAKLRELYMLEQLGRKLGFITGSRVVRKPRRI